jgi:LmbE family N-acetylglucosaminyl deacetylase
MTILIVSPHADDEVLGCGGILNADSYVYYCGIDESRVAPDPDHRIPAAEREREVAAVAEFFGFRYEINPDNKVNHFQVADLIESITDVIGRLRPSAIFIPHPGYNQDHQTVFSACQVALRPHDRNYFVKRVLVYEAICDFLWSPSPFEPNYFVPIDIVRKTGGYALHKSQVRAMRSMEMITTHARNRGMMCQAEYAEAFRIQRWVA